jgi:hypothetical protein
MTIGKRGGIVMAGKLADGESFTTTGGVVTGIAESQFSVDAPLKYSAATPQGARGLLSGALTFVPQGASCNLYGALEWNKPRQSKGDYQGGFDAVLHVSGSIYTPPRGRASVLPGFPVEGSANYGTLVLSDTSGLMLSGSAQLSPGNKLIVTGPEDDLRLTISASTGVFKGTFLYPGAHRKRTDFSGVLFQDLTMGGGYFLGPGGSGTISLTPLGP